MIGKRAKTHRKHKILPTRVSPHVESTRVTVLSIPQVPGTEPAKGWRSDGTVLKALDNDMGSRGQAVQCDHLRKLVFLWWKKRTHMSMMLQSYLRITSCGGSVGSSPQSGSKEPGQTGFWWWDGLTNLCCRAIGGWFVCFNLKALINSTPKCGEIPCFNRGNCYQH